VLFKFACDESYDSRKDPPYDAKTYVVAGFFSEARIWEKVERRWKNANERFRVPRYHASHLNAKTYEYEGWSDAEKIRYSKQMVRIIKDQKMKMHAVSCGLQVDDYREIISEQGRLNFGPPYLACFKTCLTMIATEMRDFAPEDQFAVVLDQNPFQHLAVKIFYDLKKDPTYKYRSRFATCTPGEAEEHIALQPADLIAYETFRLLQTKRKGSDDVRAVLQSMFTENPFLGYYFEGETLRALKEPMESSKCIPHGFVVSFPPVAEQQNSQRQAQRLSIRR